METRATLQDVAKLAGVGKSTVSLALRNHPRISEPTRARVRAAAEQLHYRPDPALSRIAAHRWRTREHPSDTTVAYVTMEHPWTHVEPLTDLRKGARDQGEQLGYRLEHFALERFGSPEALARVLFHRGIRGVLAAPILREDFARSFPWESFISVGCSAGYFRPPITMVVPDFHHAMVRVWKEAVATGYRRIGVALLKELEAVDLFDKVSAALFCQQRLTPELKPIPVRHFPLEDRTEFRAWLRRYEPDVVIGFNDTVHWWLGESGAKVPDEVGFISLDTELRTDREGPKLTGMDTDYGFVGHTALTQLDIQLRANQQGRSERPLTVLVPATWVPGETLPMRPEQARARMTTVAPGSDS